MSDNTHLIAMGDYRFSIDRSAYENLQRGIEYRWSKTDIIGKRPNYQMSGIGEENITITGAVFNYRQNSDAFSSPIGSTGVDQITQIREEANKAVPLRVALDNGKSLGYWVVKSIKETQSHFIGTAPLKQAFDIKLAFFGNKL